MAKKHISSKNIMRLAINDMAKYNINNEMKWIDFVRVSPKTFVKQYIDVKWENTVSK
jgi:hypothetical protein